MSTPNDPVEAAPAARPPVPLSERITRPVAIIGGLLTLAVALLVLTSVLLRWLFDTPIDGDFEFVKMATAVAIFAYLPYTQARRGNIMVDTFTGWLPPSARAVLDALWDIAYALLMGYVGTCLVFGTLDALKSGETTMQRQLLLWPSIAAATALCLFLTLTSLFTAIERLTTGSRGAQS